MTLKTPLLFMIFNRPDTTEQVFAEIRRQQPERLFVAADGPRADRPCEAALCEEARRIAMSVDWPCEVKTLFRERNLGCGKGVSSAISWFFENVEQGIILEDDCLPHPDFFPYCEELLKRYANDSRIMMISGVNMVGSWDCWKGFDYFYTRGGIWGWATWRRAWSLYKLEIDDFGDARMLRAMRFAICGECYESRMKNTKDVATGVLDTWDYQWSYCIRKNGGLSITPARNMINNIGFGAKATHTQGAPPTSNSVWEGVRFPLRHNPYFVNDPEFEIALTPSPSLLRKLGSLPIRALKKLWRMAAGLKAKSK